MLASSQISSVRYPVFSKDLERQKGRKAWKTNLELAELAASKVASCIGPAGAYKLVTYHRGPELVTKVTKDAVDIVDELGIQYPAVKTLAEAAKIHREHAGDGVSTLLVLLSSLLQEAQKLIELGIHPVVIVDGYKEAANRAMAIIDETSIQFDTDLENSLLTVIDSGRGLLSPSFKKDLVRAIRIVERDGIVDIRRIKIEKKLGGNTDESRLVEGVIITRAKAHRSMPDYVDAPRVALIKKKMELKPFEQLAIGEGPFTARLKIEEVKQVEQFKSEEKVLRAQIVESIKSSGANVVLCMGGIEGRVADMLSREGIFALQTVDPKDLDEISKATGANIVGSVSLLQREDVGIAKKLDVDKIPPEKIAILQCDGAATLLLRGSSPEIIQELEKIVKKALLVLKHSRTRPKVVAGGGAIFAELSHRMRKFALAFNGKQQLAVKAFGDALETIPRCLATNYGLDPIDVMSQLRARHAENLESSGVGQEGCADMYEARIVELAAIVKTTIWRTFEVASLLLKIDDYFHVKDLPTIHKQ